MVVDTVGDPSHITGGGVSRNEAISSIRSLADDEGEARSQLFSKLPWLPFGANVDRRTTSDSTVTSFTMYSSNGEESVALGASVPDVIPAVFQTGSSGTVTNVSSFAGVVTLPLRDTTALSMPADTLLCHTRNGTAFLVGGNGCIVLLRLPKLGILEPAPGLRFQLEWYVGRRSCFFAIFAMRSAMVISILSFTI